MARSRRATGYKKLQELGAGPVPGRPAADEMQLAGEKVRRGGRKKFDTRRAGSEIVNFMYASVIRNEPARGDGLLAR